MKTPRPPRSPRAPPGPAQATEAPQLVVGIGASAGGLKALQLFVEAIPADSGMAFVVILHLDPERESRMGELLQDRSTIPVAQVSGPTVLAANHIYIIPPGHDLAMRHGTLELRDRGERASHAPVDLFFRTLAEACGEKAVGVVLSGTGTDGSSGIRYIREAGGITIAQDPDESEYEGMPASAIATDLVDLVLPSGRIPAELLRLRRLPLSGDGTPPEAQDVEAALTGIFATLRAQTGHDFSLYKRSTVLRRLDRRLRFNDVTSLPAYQAVLQSSATECNALLRDLLISVSSFFRDPEAFEGLAALASGLFAGKGPADTVRVWVVGCATGEEVYSIAMVFAEHAATLKEPPAVQFFATDIDERGYAWARSGFYSAAATGSIPPERLRRFFTRENGGYRIAKSLREQVLFAGHNVLHDPPFSRIDLVSCRNLFIYLQPEAQKRALETFHFSLNPDGLLFLGASETLDDSGLFLPAAKGQRLFRRSASSHRIVPRLAAADPKPALPAPGPEAAANPAPGTKAFPYGALHLRMLEQYAPASVVVNERLEILHLSAGAGRFLRLGAGEPTRNLLGLAGEEQRRALRTALHHAFEQGVSSTRRVGMVVDGERRMVTIQVRPSPATDGAPDRHALVLFEAEAPSAQATPELAGDTAGETELEEEVRRIRELLESTTSAHDRTVAELQTVNEELQSINEEQRAASEELETSREEIQSVNEELITINQEHQSTIDELKRTNADLQNLIESTEIGTIFLDRKLRIRLFTPAVAALFNFVPADRGRAFSHITHRLRYAELHEDVGRVLSHREHIEREVASATGAWYIVRISPYRSLDGGCDGVVLTFFDNTAQHLAAEELRQAKVVAESANVAKGAFLSTVSHEFRTPLNAILGYADLLAVDGALNAPQKLKIERIKTGGWHLAAMIEDILTFSKLDGGHELVDKSKVDARAIAADVGALAEPAAAAKQLAFILEVPDGAVHLVTDPVKTRQILVNLCENAVKFTSAGQVALRLSADAERVTFVVSDTGIGIEPEHHAWIFERFWQVNGSSTRSAGGLGIGLASAREHARLLGGDVTVESVPGSGSTFRLWLPRKLDQ